MARPACWVLIVLCAGLVGCGGTAVSQREAAVSSSQTTTIDRDQTGVAVSEPSANADGAALVLLAEPDTTVDARSAAEEDAPIVARLHSRIDGPQAFLATMSFEDWENRRSEPEWIEVLLPIRPNGRTGWIRMDAVTPYRNGYRIDIHTDDFRMRVSKDGETIVETVIALGAGDTPTPLGRFYLTELIRANDPTGVYGPYAFGLSGYSNTLEAFGTGEGVIGIHGTNEPQALGTSVSHGCIRVANDQIELLAGTLPLGTPVEIH